MLGAYRPNRAYHCVSVAVRATISVFTPLVTQPLAVSNAQQDALWGCEGELGKIHILGGLRIPQQEEHNYKTITNECYVRWHMDFDTAMYTFDTKDIGEEPWQTR